MFDNTGGRGSGGNRKTALLSRFYDSKNKKGYVMESKKKREYGPDDYLLEMPSGTKCIVKRSSKKYDDQKNVVKFNIFNGECIEIPSGAFILAKYTSLFDQKKSLDSYMSRNYPEQEIIYSEKHWLPMCLVQTKDGVFHIEADEITKDPENQFMYLSLKGKIVAAFRKDSVQYVYKFT